MEGADSGGGRRIVLKRGWMDGWHGGDFTFIPEMHVCDGRGIDRDMHREEGQDRERQLFLTLLSAIRSPPLSRMTTLFHPRVRPARAAAWPAYEKDAAGGVCLTV